METSREPISARPRMTNREALFVLLVRTKLIAKTITRMLDKNRSNLSDLDAVVRNINDLSFDAKEYHAVVEHNNSRK